MALTLVWTPAQTPLTDPQRQAQPVLRTPVGTRHLSLSYPRSWECLASLTPFGHQSPEGFLQHLGIPGGTHPWGDRGGFRGPENTLDTTQHVIAPHLRANKRGLGTTGPRGTLLQRCRSCSGVGGSASPEESLSEEGAAVEVVSSVSSAQPVTASIGGAGRVAGDGMVSCLSPFFPSMCWVHRAGSPC